MANELVIRRAVEADVPALLHLQSRSVRELGRRDYTVEQIDAFLDHIGTMDPQLVSDRTYFLAEVAGQVVGCGGWTYREHNYEDAVLPPGLALSLIDSDAMTAYVRAVFVHPDWVRCGVASRIMQRTEADIEAEGFQRIRLLATLTGVPLYQKLGYRIEDRAYLRTPNDILVPGVSMRKEIAQPHSRAS